jgi:hypothetical protein
MALVPSYLYKVARAKKHLVELDEAVAAFAARRPYRVAERVEGEKKPRLVRRLEFTADPSNGDIPIIAADVIYNLRSALDHLMSALVAKKDRRSAMFPIYFDGVWEAIVPGENQQRVKERVRWASDTKTISPDAVAVLKSLQPPDGGGDHPQVSMLEIINTLSNRDRHEKLPVVASGLKWPITVQRREADGTSRTVVTDDPNPEAFLKDKAEISNIPDDAVDVEVAGTPVVAIDLGGQGRYAVIPEKLGLPASYIETIVIPCLLPYVRAV